MEKSNVKLLKNSSKTQEMKQVVLQKNNLNASHLITLQLAFASKNVLKYHKILPQKVSLQILTNAHQDLYIIAEKIVTLVIKNANVENWVQV